MPYGSLKEVSTGLIAEREYCVANRITTTGVSSCIVVASRAGSSLFAIHLSIVGEGSQLADSDADAVAQVMNNKGADTQNVHIYGEVGFWGPGQPSGYKRLMSVLGNPSSDRMHQRSGNITLIASEFF